MWHSHLRRMEEGGGEAQEEMDLCSRRYEQVWPSVGKY